MALRELLSAARRLTASVRIDDRLPVIGLSQEVVANIREPTSLTILLDLVQAETVDANKLSVNVHASVILLDGALRNPQGFHDDADATPRAEAIQDYIVDKIIPPPSFAELHPRLQNLQNSEIDVLRYQLIGLVGLRALSCLAYHFPGIYGHRTLEVVTCLACYTDPRELWMRPSSEDTARRLLKSYLQEFREKLPQKPEPLVSELLRLIVQPVFAGSKSRTITQAGRKATDPLPSPLQASEDRSKFKPWKHSQFYISTVFRWAIFQLDYKTSEKWWHLVTPPILTLIDDEGTISKIRGCDLLQTVLERTPSSLLTSTGLGAVFVEALLPYLSYLPTLTLEDESLQLQSSAYTTLLALVRKQFFDIKRRPAKNQILDKILRTGILSGLTHTGDYSRLATLLLQQLCIIVNELGVWSAKHLKYIIPLLNSYFCSPFLPDAPQLLRTTIRAMQKVILVNWPRIEPYSAEILQGIAICWYRLTTKESHPAHLVETRSMLSETFQVLLAALDDSAETSQRLKSFVRSDKRLQGLLEDPEEVDLNLSLRSTGAKQRGS